MSPVEKAKEAFASARLPYSEADVLRVELLNTPGALANFAGKLTHEDINIKLGYQTNTKGSRKATIVLAVSDLDKAASIGFRAQIMQHGLPTLQIYTHGRDSLCSKRKLN